MRKYPRILPLVGSRTQYFGQLCIPVLLQIAAVGIT
jgi:hypothetical protein